MNHQRPAGRFSVTNELVIEMLNVIRDHIGMDVVYMSALRSGQQVFEFISGDAERFGIQRGFRSPVAGSYAQRVIEGTLPPDIPDTHANPDTNAMEITHTTGVRSYVAAPIRTTSGDVTGMVCGVSARPSPELGGAELRILTTVAELVGSVQTLRGPTALGDSALIKRLRSEMDGRLHTSVFQPIVAVKGMRVAGVEALSRFSQPPDRPDRWFSDAEAVGLGLELEFSTMRQAISQIDQIPEGAYLSVNASPAAIADPRLAELTRGVDPSRLVLEITEHAAIGDYSVLRDHLRGLREAGVRVAVDDVGAGFSSFSHVLELRPDVLKIDRSLTSGADSDPARRSLISVVIELARRFDSKVVAEGVETSAEFGALAALGVDLVQGYLIARPGPLPVPEIRTPHAVPKKVEPDDDDTTLLRPQGGYPFELIMHHSPIGKALIGLDGSFLHANPAMLALVERDAAELTSVKIQDVTHPQDRVEDRELRASCIAGTRTTYKIDKRYVTPTGRAIWVSVSVVLIRSDEGQPLYFISQALDIDERKRREQEAIRYATRDRVTGALARGTLIENLTELIAGGSQVALIMCTFEELSCLNAQHGFVTVDEMLRTTAQRLESAVRADDMVGRWNDSSFLVVITGTGSAGVAALEDRIHDVTSRPMQLDGEIHSAPALSMTGIRRASDPSDDATGVATSLLIELERRAGLFTGASNSTDVDMMSQGAQTGATGGADSTAG
ncbi:MAG: EAL domain-containing protein [Microthrixaceae bacterium]